METFRRIFRKGIGMFSVAQILRTSCLVLSGMGCVLQTLSPFGVACATAVYCLEPCGLSALWIALGIGLGGFGISALKYWIAVLLLTAASAGRRGFVTERTGCVFYCIALFLADLIYGGFAEKNLYFWILAGAELVVGLFSVHAYITVFRFLSAPKLRRSATAEELFCIAAVFCICLSGLTRLQPTQGLYLAETFSVFIVLFSAYSFSVGACVVLGTVLGFFVSLLSPSMLYAVGAYSVAALFCCVCKRLGKPGIVAGMVLSDVLMTFYTGNPEGFLIGLPEIFIAGVVFLLMPKKRLLKIKQSILLLTQRQGIYQKNEREAFEKMAVKRLNRIADAFSVLAASMGNAGKIRKEGEKETAALLTADVYERVCGKCEQRSRCILREETARSEIAGLLQKTIHRGWAERTDLSANIKNRCLQNERMLSECNKVYEVFRVNRVWENRIAENRELVSKQLSEVSGVVRCLANEITETVVFEEESEKRIITLLDGLGMYVENVSVTKGLNNRLEAEISVLDCKSKEACIRDSKAVLSKVTGRNFSLLQENTNRERSIFTYREKENFEAQIGISRIRPSKEQACGDSYAIMYPEEGKLVIALSDGMGTGNRAAKESRETVGLLEHMLMAGIARETAVRLINSVLVLKSYDENFATLDLLVLDLFSGEGEIIKNASACSYLCRGNQVGVLAAQALPAGIVGEIETANRRLAFCSGDWILLVSDGVTDVSIDDKWIKDFLINLGDCSAQHGADKLMEEAVRRVLGCKDDMTVILVKISEK